MLSRRTMMTTSAAALAAGTLLHSLQTHAAPPSTTDAPPPDTDKPNADQNAPPPGEPGKDYTPVVTPNGLTLPYKLVVGVKVFHLIAEEVEHEFAPGLKAKCWGYNGRTSGPTIEAVEGDRVRIYVTNKLPEPTTVHCRHLHIIKNDLRGG